MAYPPGAKSYFDNGDVVFGVYVLSASGIAFMATGICGPTGNSAYCQNIEVNQDYTNADAAVVAQLLGFPWKLLGLTITPMFEVVGEVNASLLADVAASSGAPDTDAAASSTTPTPEDHAKSGAPPRKPMKPGDAVEVSTGSAWRKAVVLLVRLDGKVHVRYPDSKQDAWVEPGRVRRAP